MCADTLHRSAPRVSNHLHVQFDIDPSSWIRIFVHANVDEAKDRYFTVESNLLTSDLAKSSPAYRIAILGLQNLIRCQASRGIDAADAAYRDAVWDAVHDLIRHGDFDLRESDVKEPRRVGA